MINNKTVCLNILGEVFKWLLIGASFFYIAAYLYIALSRIHYPFELEWMEGGSVDHVKRILEGKHLYVVPSLDFVPYIYTPFYFYVSAIFAKLFGLGFFPLRLVSFLSSLGSFYLILKIVRKETGQWHYGLISSGLFAATFRISGAWFDIARVDSLFLFLSLCGFYFLRFKKTSLGFMMSAAFFFLSFMTKQTALMICLPLVVSVFMDTKKKGILLALSLSVSIAGSTLILNKLSQGWYSYYVFVLPKLHPWYPGPYWGFWKNDLGSIFLIASLMSLSFIFNLFNERNSRIMHYTAFLIGGVGSAWFSGLHPGVYDNVLMPAYLVISIVVGLTFSDLIKEGNKICQLLSVFLLVQFAVLYFPIGKQIPTTNDLRAGNEFIEKLKALPSTDIFIPHHPWYSVMSGKEGSSAQMMAIADILRATPHKERAMFLNEIRNEILGGRRQSFVLDGEFFPVEMGQMYSLHEEIFHNNPFFWPVTGASFRPRFIYRKK